MSVSNHFAITQSKYSYDQAALSIYLLTINSLLQMPLVNMLLALQIHGRFVPIHHIPFSAS